MAGCVGCVHVMSSYCVQEMSADDVGIVGVLELVDTCCEGVGIVIGHDRTCGLKDDAAAVNVVVDFVYGDAGLAVAVIDNGLVYVVAIHAHAAMFGNE